MVLRGENRRKAQVPDLVTIGRGPDCPALLIMRNGKTNRYHKVEYMGALRNKEILLCPLSALGFHFFWRWGYFSAGPTTTTTCTRCRGRSNTRSANGPTRGSGTGSRSCSSAPESSRPRRLTPPGSRRRGTRRWEGSTRRSTRPRSGGPAGGRTMRYPVYTSPRCREHSCARRLGWRPCGRKPTGACH
jgi:centromere DNA-binding complex CBF3 subunit-like protein